MKTLKLTPTLEKTLDHCFRYGEAAASTKDYKDGSAARRKKHIDKMRKQLQELNL